MTGQMSVAEEKILTVPKEELLELCRRFSEGEMTEEEYNEENFYSDAFETRIPERADIGLEDLVSIYTMMTGTGLDLDFESWSDRVIPERFRALTLSERLDFLEKLADSEQSFSFCLADNLLEYHLGLPEGSATLCIIESIMDIIADTPYSGWLEVGDDGILKSLVKLIRLEMGIQV